MGCHRKEEAYRLLKRKTRTVTRTETLAQINTTGKTKTRAALSGTGLTRLFVHRYVIESMAKAIAPPELEPHCSLQYLLPWPQVYVDIG